MQAFLNTRYYNPIQEHLDVLKPMLKFIVPHVSSPCFYYSFNMTRYYGSLLFTNTVTGGKSKFCYEML